MNHVQEEEKQNDIFQKTMGYALRISVLLGLVALAWWKTDLSSAFSYFNGRIVLCMILLQPLVLLCAFFLSKRYSMLLHSADVDLKTVFKAVILATGLNVALPARLSEVVKATYINERTGLSMSKGFSAVLLERIGDILILVLMALASVGSVLLQVDVIYICILGAVLVGVLLALAGSESFIHTLAGRVRFRLLARFLQQFVSHATSSLKSRSFYVAQLFGILAWSCTFLLVYLFMFFVGSIRLGLSQTMLMFTATTIGLLIPLLPGGIGTFEAAGIYVLRGFGFPLEEALVLAFGLHVSQLLFFFIASLIIVSSEKIGVGALVTKMKNLNPLEDVGKT